MAIAVAALSSCSRGTPAGSTSAASASPAVVASAAPAPTATPVGPTTKAAGRLVERNGMILIPAGEFLMGSAETDPLVYPWEKKTQQPQHPVYLDDYYIDRHEVTNVDYEAFAHHFRNNMISPCDDCPVDDVTWFEAKAYCEGQKPPKRLPTEAEWEKAAKGADPSGNPGKLEDYAWFSKNSIKRAQPVAQKLPNGYGLFDMLGNVREWTADWFDPDYYQLKVYKNPKGPDHGERRVERGGAFFLPRQGVTTTIRYNHPPHFHLYFLGFRCAQDP
jgi:iron(II)-dependent oxidoreductase